ncbi:hypothetical protein [Aureibacter tunicatorum]|uniref:Uncharacterized protein n=1 Tax=Aureibacter tunicatorum TaxID=866807 RepID=A0AAE4BU78_9BACT|nr:hypothetical protein [Aureibacter tunicatorum]MDR6240760.1 hypothetical protein [Aureibacter tunicatorum]BDD06907.1 hypothetical protein AUTU_43900 [Aureibacter tunicatorum]
MWNFNHKIVVVRGSASVINTVVSGIEILRQIKDGRMAYLGTVRDDVPYVICRSALTLPE